MVVAQEEPLRGEAQPDDGKRDLQQQREVPVGVHGSVERNLVGVREADVDLVALGRQERQRGAVTLGRHGAVERLHDDATHVVAHLHGVTLHGGRGVQVDVAEGGFVQHFG